MADLRRRFPDRDVIVGQVDAADLRLPRRRFRVVANPPYAITSSLLLTLLALLDGEPVRQEFERADKDVIEILRLADSGVNPAEALFHVN